MMRHLLTCKINFQIIKIPSISYADVTHFGNLTAFQLEREFSLFGMCSKCFFSNAAKLQSFEPFQPMWKKMVILFIALVYNSERFRIMKQVAVHVCHSWEV